jgi:hypothetical protein
MKRTSFKSIMADWWLHDNPEFKTLKNGGDWLEGFHAHVEKSSLPQLDRDHLCELVDWHKEKRGDMEDASEFVEGPSTWVA